MPLSRIATAFIEPGSPWQNGYSESFNGRFRDEFLTTEQFDTLLEAQVLAEDWRIEYNTYRPHGSLGDLTPRPSSSSGPKPNQHSHNRWTTNRVPVTDASRFRWREGSTREAP